MRLSFRSCILAVLLLLAGCSSAPVAQLCPVYEPPNCWENPALAVVRPI